MPVALNKIYSVVMGDFRRWLKHESSVENIIGHLKSNHWIDRKYLIGVEGNRMNALLAACDLNFTKALRLLLFMHNNIQAATAQI